MFRNVSFLDFGKKITKFKKNALNSCIFKKKAVILCRFLIECVCTRKIINLIDL